MLPEGVFPLNQARRLMDYLTKSPKPPVALDKALEGQQVLLEYAGRRLAEARIDNDAQLMLYYTQFCDIISDPRIGLLVGPLVFSMSDILKAHEATKQVTQKISSV